MVSRAETQSSSADNAKLAVAAVIGVAGLVGFYALADQSLLLRVIGLLVVAAVVLGLVYQTALGKRTVGYFRDARTEVRKVVWPTRAETTQTTLIVLLLVFIVGVFLWLLDSVLSWLFRAVTGV